MSIESQSCQLEGDTRFYWLVELIGQPPKYLRNYQSDNGYVTFNFTPDPHLADRMHKGQADEVARRFRDRGLPAEAREHGFMWRKP